MGFLDGLFNKATTPGKELVLANRGADDDDEQRATPPIIARVSAGSQSIGPYGISVMGDQSWERAMQFYEKVWLIFACVDAEATVQNIFPFIIKDKWGEGKQISSPRLHKLLNVRPNDYETADQFRYRAWTQMRLSPFGIFIEPQYNAFGEPVALHLLNPGECRPFREDAQDGRPKQFIDGFKIRGSDNIEYTIPRDKIIWIRHRIHPDNPFMQVTPLAGLGIVGETDYMARLFNYNFLRNDGRPGLMIAVKGRLSAKHATEIRNRFMGGPDKAGIPVVFESEAGMDVQDLSASPRDIQWETALSGTKQDIMLAFGTPESILGNASGRTFDNADAEYANWLELKMLPGVKALAQGFDKLTGSISDDITTVPDTSRVEVLQRHQREKEARAAEDLKRGVISIDDYLEVLGKDRLDVDGSDVLWLANGIVIGKKPGQAEAAAALPMVNPALAAQQAQVEAQERMMAQYGQVPAIGPQNGPGALPPAQQQQLEAAGLLGRITGVQTKIIDAEVITDDEGEAMHPKDRTTGTDSKGN